MTKGTVEKKIGLQGDGSFLIQDLSPKLSLLPQIANNPIMVKFLRIFFLLLLDIKTSIVDQSCPNQSPTILLSVYKRDIRGA